MINIISFTIPIVFLFGTTHGYTFSQNVFMPDPSGLESGHEIEGRTDLCGREYKLKLKCLESSELTISMDETNQNGKGIKDFTTIKIRYKGGQGFQEVYSSAPIPNNAPIQKTLPNIKSNAALTAGGLTTFLVKGNCN